jgi:hypothetical protein
MSDITTTGTALPVDLLNEKLEKNYSEQIETT